MRMMRLSVCHSLMSEESSSLFVMLSIIVMNFFIRAALSFSLSCTPRGKCHKHGCTKAPSISTPSMLHLESSAKCHRIPHLMHGKALQPQVQLHTGT